MKNSAALFVIVVVIIIAIGAFFATKTFRPQNSLTSLPSAQQTPDGTQPAQSVEATLFLEPESATPEAGDTVRFVARIESAAQLAGVQATVLFDPKALAIVSVDPGSLFTDPEILTNVTDAQNGTISYSLGTFSPVSATGEIFVITATVISKNGSLTPTFDQTETKIGLISTSTQRPFSENETHVTFAESFNN